jgi:hypothetical protein
MEEVVSTWLEQKHRFMVDVVLMMGLLEDEHERLQKRISTWSGDPYRPKDMQAGGGDSADSGDELEASQDIYDSESHEQVLHDDEEMIQTTDQPSDQFESITGGVTQQLNGELTQTTILESTSEGGIEPQSAPIGMILASTATATATATAADTKTLINSDKSIVASKIAEQAQDAKRLAEELAYQKELRTKALQERLLQKKLQRIQQLVDDSGVDVETARLQAEVEVFEEMKIEEEEINREVIEMLEVKENEMKIKLDEIYSEEAERVSIETEIEREEKIQEIKMKILQEKEIQINELMEEMGYTQEIAQEKCIEDFENKEISEISRIEKEFAERTEKRRLAIVESIRSEHVKSNEILENELQFQKEQKVKSLKNRLEKRKELRTNELMSTHGGGLAVHEAVTIADLEVKEILQIEQKKVEEDLNLKLEEKKMKTMNVLKEMTEKEAIRLEQDLSLQEIRQKKIFENFLQKKEKKREEELKLEGVNEIDAKIIAENEQKLAEEKCLQKLNAEILEIKQIQEIQAQKLLEYHNVKKESQSKTLKDRLAKRKAKKETELTNEEKLENFLKSIREKQKSNLEKLNQFIESKKIQLLLTAEKLDSEDVGGGSSVVVSGGNSGVAGTGGHVLQTMMLINLIKESLVNGFKKQCVYQIRMIKELIKYDSNLSTSEHDKAMNIASEQLIIQHCRDLKSLMDTQLAEQQRTRIKLENDCSPLEKIIDMEEKYYKRNVDALRKQQNKLFLSLCGVYFQSDWLIIIHENKNENNRLVVNEDEDDEENLFGENIQIKEILWDERVCQWFDGSLGLQNIYDKVPEALLSKFQVVMLQV